MRKIGLDLGSRSLGIAVSDGLNITAQGKENFKFPEKEFSLAIDKIKYYLSEYEIDTIVLGYPLRMTGTKSSTTFMIEDFKFLLEENFDLPIILVDERETTKRAQEVLISAGIQRKKRKKLKDQLAAQLILQDYLNLL
jgi:putative Holliday junction resolvase